jgi:hypothetical protein
LVNGREVDRVSRWSRPDQLSAAASLFSENPARWIQPRRTWATRLLKWRCTCRLANQRLLYAQAAEIIDAVFEKRERRTLQSAGPDQGRLVNGPKNNQLLNCVKSLVKALISQICLILATL